jgi:hypothetical protein
MIRRHLKIFSDHSIEKEFRTSRTEPRVITVPPTKPSMVLPGLILGRRGFFPTNCPVI